MPAPPSSGVPRPARAPRARAWRKAARSARGLKRVATLSDYFMYYTRYGIHCMQMCAKMPRGAQDNR
jgi:hypothetical protein